MISKHLDKNNLHHAYLIEGERDHTVSEITKFCASIDIKTEGNPDFCHIAIDSFKIDEAFMLRSMSFDKPFSSVKKIFIVSVNSITLDAQNVLLKMFEDPAQDTHFFLVVPDVNSLLKTLVSRFYFISARQDLAKDEENAEMFIRMNIAKRIDFLKELLQETEETDEGGNEIVVLDSARLKALRLLNALEFNLSKRSIDKQKNLNFFQQFFKVRKYLRMPGSSAKMLMESVALVIPEKI